MTIEELTYGFEIPTDIYPNNYELMNKINELIKVVNEMKLVLQPKIDAYRVLMGEEECQ